MKRPRTILAIDTEDDSNGQVNIINVYDGRHHWTFNRTRYGEKLRERAWAKLYDLAPSLIWACNAEYDLINLFGAWVGKMTTLQYVSSGLLRATFRDVRTTVLDTLRHWPMSVEQMGRFLGLPKLERDFESEEYCRRDTEITYGFADKMVARYHALGLELKSTLPSMAMQLFTKRFYTEPMVKLPDDVVEWMRGAYYGGRVEVYRFGEIHGQTYHYDVNSLFPSVMVTGTYPDPHDWMRTKRLNLEKEGVAHVTVGVRETPFPGLPMRGSEDMVYAYGTLEGMWCYPEIRQLLADGGTILKVHNAVEFAPMPTPFREYIEFCYGERLKAEPNSLDSVLWKLYMNSLYGKFGQKPGLEMIFDDRAITLRTKPGPAANVVWAAYVTCLARLRLLSELRRCSEVYYTDTDSLFTPDVRPVSTNLGELKLEGIYGSTEFYGNKMYAFELPSDDIHPARMIYKAKGVPKGSAKDFIRLGRATYRKPVRLRESRRSFAVANRWYDVTKERSAVYSKRKRLLDGRTVPWRWDEYLKHMEERE